MKFNEIKKQADDEWNQLQQSKEPKLFIGAATCGRSAGALEVKKTFQDEFEKRGISANIIEVGCLGPCWAEPLISIVKPGGPNIFYKNVTSKRATELVEKFIVTDDPLPEYALGLVGDKGDYAIPLLWDIPNFKSQERVLFRNFGFIDPTNINHYIANDGYSGLDKVLSMKPTEVIEEIKISGLRGRGGGGFPTGRKWEAGLQAEENEKYVVCNADEGDPGAFMDRSVLEGEPHSVLEGMIIAGYTIGAQKGYIYVRAEYPLAVKRLQGAIQQATDMGFLGENIMGSGFSFEIFIFQGAGAFVCGESTALTLSIEGKRGMPKAAPRPRTTEVGLFDKPTLLNNVKTFSYIPQIINRGGAWLSGMGTKESRGTAVFALTGMVNNCGLIEVPMGLTIREIIYDIGGGISNDKKFKAVQTGGPSGGCLPAKFLDTPVDYDSLKAAGSMMGSGGMVVMDESTCMVDIARYFLDFTQKESCGQCTLCKLGTKQMLNLLEEITEGKGQPGDIDLLLEIGEAVNSGSLCGLGQSAANPVLTTIKYFREEYEAHINEKRCPALACKALISYRIDAEKCKGCMICAKACPVDAITGEKKEVHVLDQSKCIRCGMCLEKCPKKFRAVECVPGRLNEGGK
ncbi:MAG: 4Fe-4S binding protein [Desulfobacterales bacterium]|uniref:4Fe-4S binding protein n=1 Tax=Candidatus Desulfatibia vada TaxID=2841696 RepID=A0A8J6NXQ9_9BACT|nr:4Fe-4S binding protein [Candidatus Desulfatibia vada]